MFHENTRDHLQYANMADNSGAEKTSSLLYQIVRKRRVLWWIGAAVALIVVVGGVWQAHKRIPSSSLREWFSHPPGWLMPVGLGVGALLALAILWKVPQWEVGRVRRLNGKERFDRVNEARKTLATILGGIAFLVGGFFTLQNLKVAQEGAATAQRALAVSQEGQITDRFSKAIEQLGSEKLQIRLGGIYALEGIANESKELHWPIMEVLCTYVRENAPIKRENPPRKEQKPTKPTQANQASSPAPPLAADIQAILTVLGRRDRKYEREDQYLDLSYTDIRGANLYKANLSGAFLLKADLSGAYLVEVDLTGAILVDANLRGAMLPGVNLQGANLLHADLGETDLIGDDFTRTVLDGADLSGAQFNGTFGDKGDRIYVTRGLTQQQINAAKGDSTTQLPNNLHMPESWKK